jgi:integrase
MGSVRKRGDSWRAEVRRKGVYRSQEFRTKAGAQAWIAEIEKDYVSFVLRESNAYSLTKALDRYSVEVSPNHRGAKWEEIRLAKLVRDFGPIAHKPISEIAPSDIAEWRDKRLTQVSAASVNREWNLLRSVFSVARREWGWLKDNPMRDVKRPESTRPRHRRVHSDDVAMLRRHAAMIEGYPPVTQTHRVVLAFELAIETGMRAGEIRTLDVNNIDLERGVAKLELTKNGDAREVPLSSRAREIIRILKPQSGALLPMTAGVMDSTFRKLRKRAGILDLHFHDSRAEAATRLSAKVDVLTLARILGHRDVRSLMVYYRESAADIAKRLG